MNPPARQPWAPACCEHDVALQRAQIEIDFYRTTLAWYADPANYDGECGRPVVADRGRRARVALHGTR